MDKNERWYKSRKDRRLSTVGLEQLLNRLESLVTGLAGPATKDELGAELPVGGDLPLLGDLGINDGVVVLEVGTETLGLESNPDGELEHGVALGGPDGESFWGDGVSKLVGLFVSVDG